MSTFAQAGADKLLKKYEQIETTLQDNVFGLPVHVESNGDNGTMRGDVFGIIPHAFSTVRDALGTPANWCEMVPRHLNVKACTYRHLDGECRLTLYSGRKFYEKADDVYLLDYRYQLGAKQKDYFYITLNAEEGPLDTGNYLITAEAIPLGESSTFIHFSYSYDHGFITGLAMTGYFATLASDKIGFTVVDKHDDGEPVYVDGVRGVIERNAIRYYFVIQSFLDTLSTPERGRFEARLNNWFDLTERYHAQLYEMDKKDYLKYKRNERQDQIRMQLAINQTSHAQGDSLAANGECLMNGYH
ncbi:hypothetical protein [Sulfuriflexus mobilis]|uniref:hypothetical protein n=1 Tax=Sulfuriflexus mobilis TaxID=1811807 RepID=UPI000F81E831|nr:hypothetical protein [Sulfuriflexus mobilis]